MAPDMRPLTAPSINLV